MFKHLNAKSVKILLTITFLAYVPALTNKFTNWDDNTHIVINETIKSSDPAVFKRMFVNTILDTYIPLTLLSFSLEYHLFKLNAFVFHLNNVLLHLLVVLLTYSFLVRLKFSEQIAFWMALIFGIHPIHVESVAWITERKDVLYTLFYLFALHSYLNYIESKKINHYFKAILFGVLSILSKPSGLTLPLALIAMDWFYQRKNIVKLIFEKIPFLGYVIPISLITIVPNARIILFSIDPIHTVCVFFWSLSFYLHKFIFPINLIPAYSVPTPISLLNPIYIFSILIVIAWLYFCWIHRKNRLFVFGNLIFIFTLFYVLRFAYHPLNKGMVADRFIYLPSLGLLIAVGALLETSPIFKINWNKIKLLLIGLTLLLSIKTVSQCGMWKDSLTLWNYVINKDPKHYFAYNNRAVAYQDLEKNDLAFADYEMAIKLKREYALIYTNRVALYRKLKMYDEALKDLNTLYDFKNDLDSIYFNRAAIYLDQKKYKEAIVELSGAIEELTKSKSRDFNLHLLDSYTFRALAYKETGEFLKSLEDFKQAAILEPKNFNTYFLTSEVYKKLGQYDLAIENLNKAISINPNKPMAYVVRSRNYKKMEKYSEALNDALTAQAMGYPRMNDYVSKLKELISNDTK